MSCEDPAGQTVPISVDQVCGGRRAKETERICVCVCECHSSSGEVRSYQWAKDQTKPGMCVQEIVMTSN